VLCENKKTLCSESASKLYPSMDRLLSTKSVPAFAERGCHVVSATDSVPEPLLLRESGSARNRARTSGSVATVQAAVVAWTIHDRRDPFLKVGNDRGRVCTVTGKFCSLVLYVLYLHLTKAKDVHKKQIRFLVREDVTQGLWPQGFSCKEKVLSWAWRSLSPRRIDWW
jgi:hypothetical protein